MHFSNPTAQISITTDKKNLNSETSETLFKSNNRQKRIYHHRHPNRRKRYKINQISDIDTLLDWTNYNTFEKVRIIFF